MGWWGKVDFCMLEQRGILLKLWVIICLCIEGDIWGKGEFICQSISMEKFGIQVLRVTNKEILSNLYGVCEYIDLVVKNRLKKLQDSWKAQQRGIFLQTHIEDSTFHHLRWSPSLSREGKGAAFFTFVAIGILLALWCVKVLKLYKVTGYFLFLTVNGVSRVRASLTVFLW